MIRFFIKRSRSLIKLIVDALRWYLSRIGARKQLKHKVVNNPNIPTKSDSLWREWVQKGGYYFKKRGKQRYDFLIKLFRDELINSLILDVGCGIGYVADSLLKAEVDIKSYVGFDFSKEAIKIAKSQIKDGRFHFICDSISSFDIFSYPRFDFILLYDFLEHNYIDVVESVIRTYITHCRCMVIATPYRNKVPHETHITEFDEAFFLKIFSLYNGKLDIRVIDNGLEMFVTFRWNKYTPIF